jgi:hypothetical protein
VRWQACVEQGVGWVRRVPLSLLDRGSAAGKRVCLPRLATRTRGAGTAWLVGAALPPRGRKALELVLSRRAAAAAAGSSQLRKGVADG